MLDLNAIMSFTPKPAIERKKKSKPKERVYVAGKARGFQALDDDEKELRALEKYAEIYRLYMQWNDNLRITLGGAKQKHFAHRELEALEGRMKYWDRYILSEAGIKEQERIISHIKNNWRAEMRETAGETE